MSRSIDQAPREPSNPNDTPHPGEHPERVDMSLPGVTAPAHSEYEPQRINKRPGNKNKLIAGVAALSVASVGITAGMLLKSRNDLNELKDELRADRSYSAPLVPGAEETQSVNPLAAELAHRQSMVNEALPHLRANNTQTRSDFEAALDKTSFLKGANYFKDRGLQTEATADMSASDALDWIHLQTFKAWNAARYGDTAIANSIANAITEGKELRELVASFGSSAPNVSASFVTDQAPVYTVEGTGSIQTPFATIAIDNPGAKLYAFTAMNPNDSDFVEFVIRYTPSTTEDEGAWSVVTTLDVGTIDASDISQQ